MKTKISFFATLLALIFLASACGLNKAKPEGNEAPGADPANVPELIWFMGSPGLIPPDQEMVEARLNEISVEKIGAKVKTVFMSNDQITLSLASGEAWDTAFTCEWFNNYAVQALAGYFADITDLLPTVAPDLWADMPEVVWDGAKVNGRIMAIPVKKDYAAEMYFQFDRELYADLGLQIPDAMNFFELEPYLTAAKQAYDAKNPLARSQYPLTLAKSGLNGILSGYDMINHNAMLGIPYSAIGTANENKVVFIPESQEALDRLEAMHRWYKAGYINPDAMTSDTESSGFAVRTGQGFYGADAIWSGGAGFPLVISKFSGPFLSTASIRGAMNAANARSQNIEKALKLHELINTDQEYRDILRYGIEGVHWNKTPEGLAMKTQAGRDGYSVWAFSQGSYSLATVEAAEGINVDPNMWNVIFDGYKNIKATKSIGFSFDPTNVEAEIAAVFAVRNKYWDGMTTGTLDPADIIPRFIAESEAAGIRKVIEECQRQYDEFLAKR